LVPVFVLLMYFEGSGAKGGSQTGAATLAAMVVFGLAAATDSLDGHLARRSGQITRLGQFLDPLADKLLVGAAIVTLAVFRSFPLWAAIAILGREVFVSAARAWGLRKGRSMPATLPGKIKTSLQVPMVIAWLMPRNASVGVVQDVLMVAVVVMTLLSGALFMIRMKEKPDA